MGKRSLQLVSSSEADLSERAGRALTLGGGAGGGGHSKGSRKRSRRTKTRRKGCCGGVEDNAQEKPSTPFHGSYFWLEAPRSQGLAVAQRVLSPHLSVAL